MTASPMLHPVHLVGAGPGDPELLTLKAVRVLRQATVILIDDLVGERVLEEVLDGSALARPRIVHVGKRGGCASTPQAFIEKLLVREALAGEKVVRLKGGDPLVFGRAGEEIAALREAGVPVVVVNGITAGLAAVNALGTGWTDRRHAQGVMLVTGHAQPGASGPDWAAIGAAAATGITLVIYMGVAQAPQLVAQLLAAGLPAELPAGVVQHASTDHQRCGLSTLGGLVEMLHSQQFGSPAVLVIGHVLDAAALQALPLADPATALRTG
ncbi:MAG TPA: uroporphyrinogen-III C-methyltransferase [Ideonella sp.]|uniref:uroporphyrinogen-III C-methyltransferase n=1 Tax=Ideonella sp. TaxID=1929293 RepID=UPI002CE737B1|nr:uroporphyrinogen-III C-methyltransferase [Ideonella sp.]HSI52177.1 uroporphyrinogen-III C-methyltransferase [Ideonella sp.]